MKEIFNIKDVAMMTGLSTRTIRHYISDGFLNGDKSGGEWQFTAQDLDSFMHNDVVRCAVRAKRNAIIYDYIGTKPQGESRMCMILDLPADQEVAAMTFFCKHISDMKPKTELRFASDRIGKGVRVILSGSDSDIMNLLSYYYNIPQT